MKLSITALLIVWVANVSAQDLSLPFNGRWFVAQGGDTLNVNHHMRSQAQAYGVDFAKVGGASQRELTRGTLTKVEDFFSWGEPVLAPADGTVVSVVTNLPDNPIGTKDTVNAAGNHVVMRIAEERYVFLAHMQQGSITVKPGDIVQRGTKIGLCGNSGNSDFPHIHLHVQNTATLNAGFGQNPVFGPMDVELTGKQFESVTWPLIRGLFVSNP